MQRPACSRVATGWDEVIERFLRGEPTNVHDPFDGWFRCYKGSGNGSVDLTCFPEPYLGDIFGEPRAAILALNPGVGHQDYQSKGGIFAKEIKDLGSYREWARTWPYLDETGVTKSWGYNRHHASRMQFLRRWYQDDTLPNSARIDFELFPWHSASVTGPITPSAEVVREFIWGPLCELRVEFIFAFGKPWLQLLGLLPDLEVVDRIGVGGRPYATSRKHASATEIVMARTPWGGWFLVEKHSGSAGPPSSHEIDRIKTALGFD